MSAVHEAGRCGMPHVGATSGRHCDPSTAGVTAPCVRYLTGKKWQIKTRCHHPSLLTFTPSSLRHFSLSFAPSLPLFFLSLPPSSPSSPQIQSDTRSEIFTVSAVSVFVCLQSRPPPRVAAPRLVGMKSSGGAGRRGAAEEGSS